MESILEENVNFESIFENFEISKNVNGRWTLRPKLLMAEFGIHHWLKIFELWQAVSFVYQENPYVAQVTSESDMIKM